MNTAGALILWRLKNRQELTEDDIQILTPEIERYQYPMGMIPTHFFTQTKQYKNETVLNNYNYFFTLVTSLLSNYYTEDELKIISIYYLTLAYTDYILPTDFISLLDEYLEVTSDKTEIEYCLDEIRFKRLVSYTYIENYLDNDGFITLLNKLRLVEEEHNQIQLGSLKDES